jgi:MtN3 and saliva related transmembrane protein
LFIGEITSAAGFAVYSWMLHNIVYVVANGFTLLSSVIGVVVLVRNRRRQAARERA